MWGQWRWAEQGHGLYLQHEDKEGLVKVSSAFWEAQPCNTEPFILWQTLAFSAKVPGETEESEDLSPT